jgi:hypothetical protein
VNLENPENSKNQSNQSKKHLAALSKQGQAQINALLNLSTPAADKALLEVQQSTENSRHLFVLGCRFAEELTADRVPNIELGFQRKSYPFMEGFLQAMAAIQYRRLISAESALLGGCEYSSIRRLLAGLCCEPMYSVTEDVWEEKRLQLERSASYLPLTILRRAAGPEVAEVALKALLQGGVDVVMNTRSIDLLKIYEGGSASRRLTEPQVVSLLRVFNDDLRELSVRLSIAALVGAWLEKNDEDQAYEVRNAILKTAEQFLSENTAVLAETRLVLLATVAMLKHFKDDGVQRFLTLASQAKSPGLAPLALLCRADANQNFGNYLGSLVLHDEDHKKRLAALPVFALSISPAIDKLTLSILQKYVLDIAQRREGGAHAADAQQEWDVLIAVARLRFRCGPIDSPFVTSLLQGPLTDAAELLPLKRFAVEVLAQLCRNGSPPPVWFYDRIERLRSVAIAAECLDEYTAGINDKDLKFAGAQMRTCFLITWPSFYGIKYIPEQVDKAIE